VFKKSIKKIINKKERKVLFFRKDTQARDYWYEFRALIRGVRRILTSTALFMVYYEPDTLSQCTSGLWALLRSSGFGHERI